MLDKIISNIIFYISYIIILIFLYTCFLLWKNYSYEELLEKKVILFLYLVLFLIFFYARFIERNIILVKETSIKTGFIGNIVVISDIHLGVYKNSNFLQRIVKKINQQKNIDAVLVAGDFLYCSNQKLKELLMPFKDISVPVYAVLGNHDENEFDIKLKERLIEALVDNNVIFLENSKITIPNTKINVLGLGDNWAKLDNVSLIKNYKKEDNLIVLTHNPDTTLLYNNDIADITITGHTHGGQIRIPFLYKYMIPCVGNFNKGLYQTKNGFVFVSSGLGEVKLPLRLGVPPVIDILRFY